MKTNFAQEIEQKMDRFFERVTDDEFVAILRDIDWEHYASLPPMPFMETQFTLSVKPSSDVPRKPWSLPHRTIPNKTATQDRLAA